MPEYTLEEVSRYFLTTNNPSVLKRVNSYRALYQDLTPAGARMLVAGELLDNPQNFAYEEPLKKYRSAPIYKANLAGEYSPVENEKKRTENSVDPKFEMQYDNEGKFIIDVSDETFYYNWEKILNSLDPKAV
jgi:hypothetical protein